MNVDLQLELLSATAANLIALIILRALWHKMRDVESFAALVAEYRVVPEWATDVAARIILVSEAVAVLALSSSGLERGGAAIAVTMLLAYGAAIASNMFRGRTNIDCGCGSPGQGLRWQMVIRNLVLAAIAALPLISHSEISLSVTERALTVAAALPLCLGVVLVEQILVNSARQVSASRDSIQAPREEWS